MGVAFVEEAVLEEVLFEALEHVLAFGWIGFVEVGGEEFGLEVFYRFGVADGMGVEEDVDPGFGGFGALFGDL